MTAFFLYFETKNISSSNYHGFSDVGNFVVPKLISSGKIPIILNKKEIMASMISDGSNHGIVDYFIGSEKHEIRNILFEFIEKRISNDAIIANIIKFIYNNQKNLVYNLDSFLDIKFHEFKTEFNESFFQPKKCIRITS